MNFKEEKPKKVLKIESKKQKLALITALAILSMTICNFGIEKIKKAKQCYRDNMAITLTFLSNWGNQTAKELENKINREYPNFLEELNPLSIRSTKLEFVGREVMIPCNSSDEIINLKEELDDYINAYYSNKYEDTNIDIVSIYTSYHKQRNRK